MSKTRNFTSALRFRSMGGAVRHSKFWTDFDTLTKNAFDWYGMDEMFVNLSFNVLGVENSTDYEVLHKNSLKGHGQNGL